MGGSAGGNLSAAVALSLIDQPELQPKGVIVACATTIHPDVIPDEYKSYWHPELLADSAMLNRDAIKPCMGEWWRDSFFKKW
jgi:acetyl esterase/lipase